MRAIPLIHLVSQRAGPVSFPPRHKSTRSPVTFSGTHTGHRVKVESIVLLSYGESTLRARRGLKLSILILVYNLFSVIDILSIKKLSFR